MIEKIKTLLIKIKKRIFYNCCYNNMEAISIATFGMCSGMYNEKYRTDKCSDCPYFRDLRKDDDND